MSVVTFRTAPPIDGLSQEIVNLFEMLCFQNVFKNDRPLHIDQIRCSILLLYVYLCETGQQIVTQFVFVPVRR